MSASSPQPSSEHQGKMLEIDTVRLAWGNAARWKARWRDESVRKHLALPVGERLRRALSMLVKRSNP